MSEPSDVDAMRATLTEARRSMARRMAVHPRAFSIDGHTFQFQAPIDANLEIGGFVHLQTRDGRAYLGQITEKSAVEQEGPEVSVEGDAGLAGDLGDIRVAHTAFRVRLHHAAGGGVLLARQDDGQLLRLTISDVFDDASIEPASTSLVEQYLQEAARGRATLDVGTLRIGNGQGRANLLATGFDRHTFLCGQSGSGKTYALGVMLERLLLETDLQIVIIDPNGDYVRIAEPRTFQDAERGFGGALDAAGYAALRERYLAATERVRVLRPVPPGSRSPDALRLRFSNLSPTVQGMVLQLDPLADREEFSTFWSIVNRLGDRAYSPRDVLSAAAADFSAEARQVALRVANLGVSEWDIWADSADEALTAESISDTRALVLDVGGFANPAEKSLVALGVFNALWARREQRRPILVVVDEAHNIAPREPVDRLQAAATERAIQIAGEGRKFGLYLLLSTQRPQKLHPNVLSQCDNLVLMRMNSAADLAHLTETFSFVPPALLGSASAYRQGESLVAGKIAPSPLLTQFGGRISEEGGSDIATAWATPRR